MVSVSFQLLCSSATFTDNSGLLSVSDMLGKSRGGAWGEDGFLEGIPAGGTQLGTEASLSSCGTVRTQH